MEIKWYPQVRYNITPIRKSLDYTRVQQFDVNNVRENDMDKMLSVK